jgi:hypothetical protein
MRASLLILAATVLCVLAFGWFWAAGDRGKGPVSSENRAKRSLSTSVGFRQLEAPPSEPQKIQMASKPPVSGVVEGVEPEGALSASEEDSDFEEAVLEADRDIAHFDANATKFDEWQALLGSELAAGQTDDEEAQHWLTLAEEALRGRSPDARVRVRCAASICEIALRSPEPTAHLLGYSARWLRLQEERAIGETSAWEDEVEASAALDTERQKTDLASASDASDASEFEGFSILVPNRSSAPP